MRARRGATAILLALLGPLPLPHVDSYLPLALGLFAAATGVEENGPAFLGMMTAVLVVYAAVVYGVLTLVSRLRKRPT